MKQRGDYRRRSDAGRYLSALAVCIVCCLAVGCYFRRPDHPLPQDQPLDQFHMAATEIEYPDAVTPSNEDIAATSAPITIRDGGPEEYWDLTLEKAIEIALTNSTVLRDLGGQVLTSPSSLRTIQAPAIQETDPRFGVDAALSAFDASFATAWFFEKNDHPLNNPFFTGGRTLKQDLASFETSLSKRTATGADLALRKTMEYDFNNTPGNPLASSWNVMLDAEVRQPLLQGAGHMFNRIAGPGAAAGSYNGVLIARINTDISLADFQIGVRNLVADVEQQYWELYYAYRDLDAKIAARERALETWRRIHALFVAGRRGGEAEKEAQAREQYYRLEEDVQNALTGRQYQKSRTIALAFRGVNGVHANERQLRLLMGVPLGDRRLIRPVNEPTMVRAIFDWEKVLYEALTRRSELRRQQWSIKQRELELIASRNFLYPTFDAVGRYRWRGFGKDLIDPSGTGGRFDNAFDDLTTGDFQEWQLGFEFALPIGLRQGHAAVRNAQLRLTRERAVLEQQERDVAHDLASSVAEMERAYAVAQTNFNRRLAGRQQLAALEAVYDDADENQKGRLLDLLLDAQRRLADAESRYYRSVVEYQMAVTQVHLQKGSLLDYNEVRLSEGPWPVKAGDDMDRRRSMRVPSWRLTNFILQNPPIVSQGPIPQQTAPADAGIPTAGPLREGTDVFPLPPVDVEGNSPVRTGGSSPRKQQLLPTAQRVADPQAPPAVIIDRAALRSPAEDRQGNRQAAYRTAAKQQARQGVDRQAAGTDQPRDEDVGPNTTPPRGGEFRWRYER